MARRLLRKIAKEDGSDDKHARSFAECCINILQNGCRYNKATEYHIKRLLTGHNEQVCEDILNEMDKPHRTFFRPKNMGPPPPPPPPPAPPPPQRRKRRFQSPVTSPIQTRRFKSPIRIQNELDRKRPLYYEDRNPHVYNKHRPTTNTKRKPWRKRFGRTGARPGANSMGRVEPERGRVLPRVESTSREPERKANGSQMTIPNFVV